MTPTEFKVKKSFRSLVSTNDFDFDRVLENCY